MKRAAPRRSATTAAPRAAASLALALLAACSREAPDTLPGTLERTRIELAAEANEVIAELRVTEGQKVAAGALILVQDATVTRAQLAAVEAQRAQAAARLAELRNGALATTIGAAAARRDRARSDAADQRRERERLRELVGRSLVSREAFDRQAAAAEAADASLREAEAALNELQRGTRAEQVAQARHALEQIEAQRQELLTTSGRLELRAPVDATVDALPFNAGEKPVRGATVAVLLGSGAPFARIYVPVPLRARFTDGAAATVHVEGSTRSWRGRVRHVSSDAAFTPYYALTEQDRTQLSYRADVVLEETDALALPTGLPVQVTLQAATAP
jgi:HlyD family secretion protein